MILTKLTETGQFATRPYAEWFWGVRQYTVVDLSSYFNNDGITHLGDVPNGDLNGEGMAFPYEELPGSNEVVVLGGVPFLFPNKESGDPNNVCPDGQTIAVPAGAYSMLHMLGACEGGSFEEPVTLQYEGSERQEIALGLTDCRPHWGAPRFGEEIALTFDEMHFPPGDPHTSNAGGVCGLWIQSLPVDDGRGLVAAELGDNECMHVFAMTLRRGEPRAEEVK